MSRSAQRPASQTQRKRATDRLPWRSSFKHREARGGAGDHRRCKANEETAFDDADDGAEPSLKRRGVIDGGEFAVGDVVPAIGHEGLISCPAERRDRTEASRGVSRSLRSEERRVGKEGVSTCTSRWSPNH